MLLALPESYQARIFAQDIYAFQNFCFMQAKNPSVWKRRPHISRLHHSLPLLLRSYGGRGLAKHIPHLYAHCQKFAHSCPASKECTSWQSQPLFAAQWASSWTPQAFRLPMAIFFNKWFGSADILAHLKGQKLQRVYSSHLTQMIACLMVHGAVQQQGLTERVLHPRTIQRISLCAAQTKKK